MAIDKDGKIAIGLCTPVVCAILFWFFYCKPLVKTSSISMYSSSIAEAKKKKTYICSYAVTDVRHIAEYSDSDSDPKIDECFAEYFHYKMLEYRDSVFISNKSAEIVIQLKGDGLNKPDKDRYYNINDEGIRNYRLSTPIPTHKIYYEDKMPPDTFSVLITRGDSIPIVSYSLKRQEDN